MWYEVKDSNGDVVTLHTSDIITDSQDAQFTFNVRVQGVGLPMRDIPTYTQYAESVRVRGRVGCQYVG